MDANRDSALQCIRIARKKFKEGNIEDAKRLLVKGLRLDPHVSISGLESLVKSSFDTTSQPPPRRRSTSRGRDNGASTTHNEAHVHQNFTKAETEAVRKILSCKDYYDVLGVDKNCSEDELKKAYKVLALKFHPDKNRAPGATEAFKKIGNVMAVLSDPEKRRKYNQYGTTEDTPPVMRYARHGEGPYGANGFDSEVFNMFFNSGFPFSNVYRGQRQRPAPQNRDTERENNYFVCIQLLPLLILFGLSFFSSLFVKDPFYNLSRTEKYTMERVTNNYHVSYYVKPSFANDYDGSLHQLEKQVDEDYATNLRYRCFREKEHRENQLLRARYYGDDESYNRASRVAMPSCERLGEIFGG